MIERLQNSGETMWVILVSKIRCKLSAFPKTHKKLNKTFAEKNYSNDYFSTVRRIFCFKRKKKGNSQHF